MSRKLFVVLFAVLLTAQSLDAWTISGLVNKAKDKLTEIKQEITGEITDIKNKLDSGALDNKVAELEKAAQAKIDEIKQSLQSGAVKDKLVDLKAAAEAKLADIKTKLQDFLNNANVGSSDALQKVQQKIEELKKKGQDLLNDAKNDLSQVQQELGDKVDSLKAQAQSLGQAAVDCVKANEDLAKENLQQASNDLKECVSSVSDASGPAISNIQNIVNKLQELGGQVTPVIEQCAAAGNEIQTALCIADHVKALYDSGNAAANEIKDDIQKIEEEGQGAKDELNACKASAQKAVSNIKNIVNNVELCIKQHHN